MRIAGWGRYPVADCRLLPGDAALPDGALIPRGNGRSYGDSALNPDATIDMRRCNRMLAFDAQTGVLVAEAGVLLADIVATFLPRGWFPLVTPGTRLVTLGGMIAADVHGKNHHHVGSFAACVDWIEMIDASGAVVRCSRAERADLFEWTLGGMGLTGIILRAAIRLQRVAGGHIRQQTHVAANLAEALALFDAHDVAPYSVAWIDCLSGGRAAGRSLLFTGDHAEAPGRPAPAGLHQRLRLPVDLPALALNRHSIAAFNALYFARGRQTAGRERLLPATHYFYPLDAIADWHRLYGRRGFVQFQCLLPPASAPQGLAAILAATAAAGLGSFLAVLKRMGPGRRQDGRGGLSFPGDGFTLALDFPVSPASLALLDRLDAIVLDHDGRFYLAKDARMTAETLHRSDPRAGQFAAWRRQTGAAERFASLQSRRLGL